MKKVILVLVLGAILLFATSAYSFELTGAFRSNPRTGDRQLDVTLGRLNAQVRSDKDSFISDLSISYNVPKTDIENLINNLKMLPSDAYMAVKLAQLLRKPLDYITVHYKANEGKGWGVLAKELGIKPGSAEFHALKQDASMKLEKAKERKKEKAREKQEKKDREQEKKKQQEQEKAQDLKERLQSEKGKGKNK